MKSVIGKGVVLLILLSGCSVLQNGNEPEMSGITYPFYEKTTFAFKIFDNRGGKQLTDEGATQFYKIHLRILKHLLDGEIKAYKSDSFRSAYTEDALKSRGRMESYTGKNKSIDDQAYLKSFKENIDQKRFFKYKAIQQWNWDERRSSGEVAWDGLIPVFEPTAAGVNLGEQPLAYLKYEEVAKALPGKTLDSLNALLEKVMLRKLLPKEAQSEFRYTQKNNKEIRTHRNVEFKQSDTMAGPFEKMFNHIHLSLYDSAKNSRIKAYKDETLTQTFTKEEVAKQGGVTRTTLKSPYLKDMGKKEVFLPLDPANVGHYGIQEEWKSKKDGRYEIVARAFIPLKAQTEKGDSEHFEPLFWLKGNDLEKALDASEAEWLRKYAFITLQQQLAEVDGEINQP